MHSGVNEAIDSEWNIATGLFRLVHIQSLGESGTLLIFKVKGQCHQVKFLPRNILVNTRINILQWILTKLGTYLVLRTVWNPIDFQGHWVKFLPHNILVNTLESRSFNGFRPNLVHTQTLRESGTVLIFKVKGQGHRVEFLGKGIHHALRCPC